MTIPGWNREPLEDAVRDILGTYSKGRIHKTQETQAIDFKEEAGRRQGKEILPGTTTNQNAATKLADEVACMANTPGGGALIVGVEDGSGIVIGTELDVDWLRQRINSAVQVAPDIVEYRLDGQRVLVIFVAPAREPVADTGNRLRWRVGDSCAPVDRSQWWQYIEQIQNYDVMAQVSSRRAQDITPGAERILRDLLGAESTDSLEQLLTRVGALRSDGFLTRAGELVFCKAGKSYLTLTAFDVSAGSIQNREEARADDSLLEQLFHLESSLRLVNVQHEYTVGVVREAVRLIPPVVVREAILNGLVHRDWNRSEPTEVRWVSLDSSLLVRSPGGFFGSVNAHNIVSNRDARYPALADLMRALSLVEKQGVGVDRMYQSMISQGHRLPEIYEVEGSFVECYLVGGAPNLKVMGIFASIVPEPRQRDVKIAIVLNQLLKRSFVTVDDIASALQCSLSEGDQALIAAQQTLALGEPLVEPYKGGWLLSSKVCAALAGYSGVGALPLVPYASKNRDAMRLAALQWAEWAGAVTTGDLSTLCRVAVGTARSVLEGLRVEGELELYGSGRATRYQKR